MYSPSRREVLGIVATGGATVTVIGGVLATGTGSPGDDADPDGDVTIETLATDCAGPGADAASAETGDEQLLVTGWIESPNPCHAATVEAVTTDGDSIEIGLSVASTLEDDEVCVECTGAVQYELTVPHEVVGPASTVVVSYGHGPRFELDAPS